MTIVILTLVIHQLGLPLQLNKSTTMKLVSVVESVIQNQYLFYTLLRIGVCSYLNVEPNHIMKIGVTSQIILVKL